MTAQNITVVHAIDRSVGRNEIVHLAFAQDTIDELRLEADDWVENDGVFEFWGTREAEEWRVHVEG